MSRIEKIESVFKNQISTIIQRKIDNSKIGFISITSIKISKDLGVAYVYYSQIGSDAEKENTFKSLNKAAKYIRYELGKVVRLRKVPNLKFFYDESLERGVHLVNKINKLNETEEA